ncbi:MAG: hypothetical protein CM1200mP2_31760 [Planctomycetaceae bacterium]|nr:MAG: hypothetical protein CM1200mP2_31760 [Planctomycetaceae bacterium]
MGSGSGHGTVRRWCLQWWIGALDDRIRVAVPVAGITDLTNHVVDGCVEGHCDCMFQVNTFGWDYAQVAALLAPRPLLISNSDKDRIFPLDGVVRIHKQVRRIYELHGQSKQLGLQITEGPHKDTQELRVHAFHWFNRFLKKQDPLITDTAVKFFTPEQLRVFGKQFPADEKNTEISETFTARAETPTVPGSADDWAGQTASWREALATRSFRGWPSHPDGLDLEQGPMVTSGDITARTFWFNPQGGIRLPLVVLHRKGLPLESLDLVVLNTVDDGGWTSLLASLAGGGLSLPGMAGITRVEPDKAEFAQTEKMFQSFKWGMAYVAPRGIGPTAWGQAERRQTQVRRRFMLLGQKTRRHEDLGRGPRGRGVTIGRRAEPGAPVDAGRKDDGRHHALRIPVRQRRPRSTCTTSQNPPKRADLPQRLRFLDSQAIAMAAERSAVRIYRAKAGDGNTPGRSLNP